MIQVYFFGPDYVALIPEDGERVVLTINEAIAYLSFLADGADGFKVFVRDQTLIYSWATPDLVKQIIHDCADRIFEIYKNSIR